MIARRCGTASRPRGRALLSSTRVMDAHAAPAFTGMKRCVNQTHVVPTANGKYSERVDDLVASSSATLLAMNDRIASPQPRSFTPPRPEGFTPSGRLLAQPTRCARRMAAALVIFKGVMSASRARPDRRRSFNRCVARRGVPDYLCGESGVQGEKEARLAHGHERRGDVDGRRASSQPPENPARSKPWRR